MPNPYQDLPKRWPLVQAPENRGAVYTQDAQLVNCYAEKNVRTGEYDVIQRPGRSTTYITGVGIGRGGFFTSNSGGIVIIIAGTVVTKQVAAGTVSVLGAVTTDFWSNKMSFAEMDKSGTGKLVFGYSADSYFTDYATVTLIADADFPAAKVPGFAYLDGTLYVMDAACNIQGSAIEDPSSWDPLNVIQARGAPGRGIGLFKHLTYVVALKEASAEAFYDAGNPTGSPLSRVEGPFSNYGCLNGDTLQVTEDTALWVSSNNTRTPQVVRMDNLRVSVISTPAVERLLHNVDMTNFCNSFMLKLGGHRFYVFTSTAVSANLTLVYDLDQNLWYRWTASDGNCLDLIDAFPTIPSAAMSGVLTPLYLVQGYSVGTTYLTDLCFTYPTDGGTAFPVDIYTPNFDAGLTLGKNLPMMAFTADRVTGGSLQVRHNDDDYAPDKWSNFRQVNLGNKRPFLDKCGTFRRRALHLRKKDALPFRIRSVDLTMLLCPL